MELNTNMFLKCAGKQLRNLVCFFDIHFVMHIYDFHKKSENCVKRESSFKYSLFAGFFYNLNFEKCG